MNENLLREVGSFEVGFNKKKRCTVSNVCYSIFQITIISTGVLVGIYLSTLLMFLAAGETNNSFLGYLTGFLVFLSFVGLFFFFLFQSVYDHPMKKSIFHSYIITQILYIVFLPIYLFIFYLPSSEPTKYTNKPSGYWHLSTGSTIAYYEFGQISSEKVPFIFLHGGPGAPVLGRDHFVDELVSSGFHVYQYDQLGGGKSTRLKNCKDYTLNRQIEDLEEIREKIGAEKINIVCHSFGGTLASNYILAHSDRVSQCIFISPGPICQSEIQTLTSEGKKDQSNCLSKNKRFLLAQFIVSVFSPQQGLFVLMPEKILDRLFMHFHDDLNMMPGSNKYYNTKGAGFGFWANLMIGSDLPVCQFDTFKKFEGKALVVKGQFDYISFDVTDEYRKHIPNSVLIKIDGIGHSVDPIHHNEVWNNIHSFIVNGTTEN